MDIVIEQERGPYVWEMNNGKWRLIRPVNIMTAKGWSDIEKL